jgi:hypothetical protein
LLSSNLYRYFLNDKWVNSEAVQKESGIAEKLSISSSRTPIRDLLIISKNGDPASLLGIPSKGALQDKLKI